MLVNSVLGVSNNRNLNKKKTLDNQSNKHLSFTAIAFKNEVYSNWFVKHVQELNGLSDEGFTREVSKRISILKTHYFNENLSFFKWLMPNILGESALEKTTAREADYLSLRKSLKASETPNNIGLRCYDTPEGRYSSLDDYERQNPPEPPEDYDDGIPGKWHPGDPIIIP